MRKGTLIAWTLAGALGVVIAASAQNTDALADEAAARELETARAELAATRSELAAVRTQLEQQRAGQAELAALRAELERARAELEQAAQEVATRAVVRGLDAGGEPRVFINRRFLAPRAALGAAVADAPGGALVTAVTPGGGAETAGVAVGDVIREIDGIGLAESGGTPSGALMTQMADIEPGATVRLGIERGGEDLELDVTTRPGDPFNLAAVAPFGEPTRVLDERIEVRRQDARPGAAFTGAGGDGAIEVLRAIRVAASPWGDMELVPMTEGLGRYFDTDEGLLVVRAPADAALGLRDGDVILGIGGRTPNSPEHAIRILSSFESGETIEFSLMREGRRTSVEYAVPGFEDATPEVRPLNR